jgi:DNA-binding transcriptional LysR family regulator
LLDRFDGDVSMSNALVKGRLEAILQAFPIPELGIYAMLPGNRHIPHRVRVLMDFLVAGLAGSPAGLTPPAGAI